MVQLQAAKTKSGQAWDILAALIINKTMRRCSNPRVSYTPEHVAEYMTPKCPRADHRPNQQDSSFKSEKLMWGVAAMEKMVDDQGNDFFDIEEEMASVARTFLCCCKVLDKIEEKKDQPRSTSRFLEDDTRCGSDLLYLQVLRTELGPLPDLDI